MTPTFLQQTDNMIYCPAITAIKRCIISTGSGRHGDRRSVLRQQASSWVWLRFDTHLHGWVHKLLRLLSSSPSSSFIVNSVATYRITSWCCCLLKTVSMCLMTGHDNFTLLWKQHLWSSLEKQTLMAVTHWDLFHFLVIGRP